LHERNGRAAKTLVFMRFAVDSDLVVGKNFPLGKGSIGKFSRLTLRVLEASAVRTFWVSAGHLVFERV
jgi:hypothetical protein